MYDGKTQLLIENPINRYLINSPMLPGLKKNPDGSLTLYIQKDSPGKAKESNWLPAPNGPIYLVMRLYWPKTEPPSILPAGRGHLEAAGNRGVEVGRNPNINKETMKKTIRTKHVAATAFNWLLVAGAVVATTPAFAQNKGGFESAPALAGSELAPSALLKGPMHTVAEPCR